MGYTCVQTSSTSAAPTVAPPTPRLKSQVRSIRWCILLRYFSGTHSPRETDAMISKAANIASLRSSTIDLSLLVAGPGATGCCFGGCGCVVGGTREGVRNLSSIHGLPLRLGRRLGLRTYPSCGVGCRPCELPLALLLLLALRTLCSSSACSAARLLLALSDVVDELRRCLLLLLSREIGGLVALDIGGLLALWLCSPSASTDSTSGTVESLSGVLMMDLICAGDCFLFG